MDLLVLRLIHIVAGAVWVGAVVTRARLIVDNLDAWASWYGTNQ